MKRILTALILIPFALLVVFLWPEHPWLFTPVVAGIAALVAWEFLGLAHASGATPPRVAVIVAILVLFAGSMIWGQGDQTVALLGILSLALLVYCTFTRPVEQMMADAATSVFCLIYVGMTLVTLPALREQPNGTSLLAFLLSVVWAGDIAALYVGRALGRHKMAIALSPNKTWEGAIGSVVGSLLATGALLALAYLFEEKFNQAWLSFSGGAWWYWLLLAVVVNIAAQVGDLVESALKRSAGVKDSGTLLPGHGGVLDRLDALLLAAPALWYALQIHQWF